LPVYNTLSLYNWSVFATISSEFVEYAWKEWKFSLRSRTSHWQKVAELLREGDAVAETFCREFFSDLMKELGFSSLEDWNEHKSLWKLNTGMKTRLAALGGPRAILQALFPEFSFTGVVELEWKSPPSAGKLGLIR